MNLRREFMNEDAEIRIAGPRQSMSIPCLNWRVDPRVTIVIKRPHRLILPTNQYNSMTHLERLLEDDFAITVGQPTY